MDGKKFDDLIRSINESRVTRRTGLRGMIAGAASLIAGAGISRVSEPAAAQECSPETHVALCHNATKSGVFNCPSLESAELEGHCGHTDPKTVFDCVCPGYNAGPDCNLPVCTDCDIAAETCFLVVTTTTTAAPTTTTTTAAPTTTTTTAAPTTTTTTAAPERCPPQGNVKRVACPSDTTRFTAFEFKCCPDTAQTNTTPCGQAASGAACCGGKTHGNCVSVAPLP
jgi:hypothetical protein